MIDTAEAAGSPPDTREALLGGSSDTHTPNLGLLAVGHLVSVRGAVGGVGIGVAEGGKSASRAGRVGRRRCGPPGDGQLLTSVSGSYAP